MKKLIITFILVFCTIMVNAQVKVLGKIEPNGPTDTYPTHVDSLGRGGFVAVKTWQERNNIPLPRRKAGMMVSVKSATVDSLYRLGVGLTNADWLPYNPTVDISGKANTDGSNTTGTWPIGINGSAMKWGPLDFTYINAGTIPTHFLVSENIDDGVIKYSDVGDVKTALSISLQDVTDFGNTTNNKLATSNSIEWGTGTYEVGKSKLYNTASDGTILTSKAGTTLDFTLTNGSGSSVFEVPHGTIDSKFYGNITAGATGSNIRFNPSVTNPSGIYQSGSGDNILYFGNYANSNKALVVNPANGNIGAGTTDPNAKLHIRQGTDKNVLIRDNGTNSEIISLNDAQTSRQPLGFSASLFDFTDGNMQLTGNVPTFTLQGTQGGAKTYALTNGITGVNNTGFAIRNTTDNRNDFYIDGNGQSFFNNTITVVSEDGVLVRHPESEGFYSYFNSGQLGFIAGVNQGYFSANQIDMSTSDYKFNVNLGSGNAALSLGLGTDLNVLQRNTATSGIVTATLPATSGTLALTSDLASKVNKSGDTMTGGLQIISGFANGVSYQSDKIAVVNDGLGIANGEIRFPSITGNGNDRYWTFPNATGTIALTSNIPKMLSLTASGDGVTGTFQIAHGLSYTPTMISVTPNSKDAAVNDLLETSLGNWAYADATYVYVVASKPDGGPGGIVPVSGVNNLKWTIMVK